MEYNPTFEKRDPVTGLVYYDFEGHIQARGVDFRESPSNEGDQTTGAPPPDGRITWKRADNTVGGGWVGVIGDTSGDSAYLWAGPSSGDAPSWVTRSAYINARGASDTLDTPATVSVDAGGTNAIIVRGDGKHGYRKSDLGNSWQPISLNPGVGAGGFFSNWRNLNGEPITAQPTGFYQAFVHNDGAFVSIKGIVQAQAAWSYGSNNAIIMQLGPGYRPVRVQFLRTECHTDASGSASMVRLRVDPNGNVYPDRTIAGGNDGAAGAYITLDGLSFPIF